jgi:ATP-dependent exoDNAse (exonuclease V) alpha subunit
MITLNDIHLSDEQMDAVHSAVNSVLSHKHFVLRGPAGTGKTTVIKAIVAEIKKRKPFYRVAVATPTGKASLVLQRKEINACTIHKLIYEMVSVIPLKFEKKKADKVNADIVIIDEASMVSSETYADLLSFGFGIIFVGDHAQLEPVGNNPRLLESFDFELTKIYRTAEENPVLGFATWLRHNQTKAALGYLTTIGEQSSVKLMRKKDATRDFLRSFDQVICGKNVTRLSLNAYMQQVQGQILPCPGDKVICLKNDYTHGTVNGEIFTVGPRGIFDGDEESEYEPYIQLINDFGETLSIPYWQEFFFDRSIEIRRKPRSVVWLDFGWAITCHKSQGSEWENILVVDEAFGTPINRWRYTAVTRSQKTLTWMF